MSKRIYTKEQIIIIKSNTSVTNCSERSISYSKDFKLKAVKQYNKEGLTSRSIFKSAGFDLEMIGLDTPKQCLKRWNRKYKLKGAIGLQTENRGGYRGGGRFKIKGLTEQERIKRLETEVAYLKAENDFLAKLRAKRAE